MKDFLARLSSRKFLVTVGLIVALTLFPDLPESVWQLALAYLGVEGAADVVRAYTASRVTVELSRERQVMADNGLPLDSFTPTDKTTIVPGGAQ